MSALDDLHGEGAREELERRLTPDGYEAEVRDDLYEDGRVDAVISWWRTPRGGESNCASATLQFWPERKEVRVASWDMRGEAGLGITTLMNVQAVGLGREWGYEVLAATGVTDPVVSQVVSQFGYAQDPDVPSRFTVDLTEPETVLERYGRMKLEGDT